MGKAWGPYTLGHKPVTNELLRIPLAGDKIRDREENGCYLGLERAWGVAVTQTSEVLEKVVMVTQQYKCV